MLKKYINTEFNIHFPLQKEIFFRIISSTASWFFCFLVRCVIKNSYSDRAFFRLFPREARAEGPSVARLINLSGRRPAEGRARELSRENSSRTYIYIYVCMFIYFREGVRILPSNGEKQSMNDVRLSGVVCSKICIHRESLRVG